MPANINKLTENQKDVIGGLVQYRFYNRITERNVYDWLRNFKLDEVDLAIEILKHIDYYREDDIINILTEMLEHYVNQPNQQLHFVPVGKPGKSGQMVVYIIQGVLKPHFPQRYRFHYYTCVDDLNVEQLTVDDVVFFVDDVIGSGSTFVKYEKNNANVELVLDAGCPATVNLLAIVTSKKGKEKLEMTYPSLTVIAEEKRKVFDVENSCFGSYYKMLPIREFAYKYGKKIEGKKNALGYENSQMLTVFSHAVPNNTLPIIWKHSDKFLPLVPRSYAEKGKKAFMDRNETNRWIFYFLKFFEVNGNINVSRIFHDKTNYSMMSVLRLKLHGMDEVRIANQLGLHYIDMVAIWTKGERMGLWDAHHRITSACQARYEEMLKLIAYQNTAYSKAAPYTEDDKTIIYVPETFRGLE